MLLGLQPHPNVAIIRDDFFEGDWHYLVLDWIAGENLRTRLRREGTPGLPYDMVIAAISDVAAALDHLHAHDPPVLHGDVKPANIVVSEDGSTPRAVLVDFGLATSAHTAELGGATLAYASPELTAGGSAGPAADVYSLAATTFELLTGRIPAPEATLDWSGVPSQQIASVRGALIEGLALDPERRPRSATDFVQGLTSGGPSTPRRAALKRARPRSGSSRRGLAAAGALVIAGLLGAGITWALVDPKRQPSRPEVVPAKADTTATESLPAGEDRVGRLGIYTNSGIFHTYAIGEKGSTALERRQEGLTTFWTTIAPISERFLLFYRSRDAAIGMISWADDGAVLDLYVPSGFETGWSHVTVVRDGQVHLYNADTGGAALIRVDDDANVVSRTSLTEVRPGWTHLTRVADGSVLLYDSTTGDAAVLGFDATGAPQPGMTLRLTPGLTTVDGVGEGRLALGDGKAGRITLVALDGSSATEIDELEIEMTWTRSSPVADHRVVLYDEPSGGAVIVSFERKRASAGSPLRLLPGGTVLIGRP